MLCCSQHVLEIPPPCIESIHEYTISRVYDITRSKNPYSLADQSDRPNSADTVPNRLSPHVLGRTALLKPQLCASISRLRLQLTNTRHIHNPPSLLLFYTVNYQTKRKKDRPDIHIHIYIYISQTRANIRQIFAKILYKILYFSSFRSLAVDPGSQHGNDGPPIGEEVYEGGGGLLHALLMHFQCPIVEVKKRLMEQPFLPMHAQRRPPPQQRFRLLFRRGIHFSLPHEVHPCLYLIPLDALGQLLHFADAGG